MAEPPGRIAAVAGPLVVREGNALPRIAGTHAGHTFREAALRSLTRLAYEVPPRILITGSLYLAGHVLAANGTPPK